MIWKAFAEVLRDKLIDFAAEQIIELGHQQLLKLYKKLTNQDVETETDLESEIADRND